MEKRIIELTKINDGHQFLFFFFREATVKVVINLAKYNDSVIGFDVCNQCLSRMQSDIQKICE